MKHLIAALPALTLMACGAAMPREDAALIAQYEPLTTEAAFLEHVGDSRWRSDEITVSFQPDGTLAGAVNGVPASGVWDWRGDLFCFGFTVGDTGGLGCSEVRAGPGEMLVVPREGRGAPYVYTEL